MTAPEPQLIHLLLMCSTVTVMSETNDRGVVCKLQQLHRRVCGGAVICVEGEEQWREDTLGGTGANDLSVRDEAPHSYLLAPVREEAIDLLAEARWHSDSLERRVWGTMLLNAELKSTNRIRAGSCLSQDDPGAMFTASSTGLFAQSANCRGSRRSSSVLL